MIRLAERVALRYKQRGTAKRKRQQRYRKTKMKSRSQGRKWRRQNKGKIKRYKRKVKVNPMRHRLKKRAEDLSQRDPIEFWDLETDQGGQVQDITDERIETVVDGESRTYDPLKFLDDVAIVFEEDEDEVYEILDPLFEDDDDDTPP